MKKLVVLAASILLYTLAQAQEGSDSGTSAGITIVPRIDFNPIFYGGNDKEVTLGNSSLYSLFEGNITENLSFSVCNHWLSDEPKYLYQNTGRADDVNWCDWAYLEYNPGNFIITAGKQVITFGGFELEEYDFDVHLDMMTGLFNNFQCYQWGGKFAFTTPSEGDSFSFQVTTSPFGERPFASKLFNYSLEWRGEHGPLETIWSATALGMESGYQPVFAFGQRLNFDSISVGLDAFSVIGDEDEEENVFLRKGITLMPSILYSPSEKFDILAKGGYENYAQEIGEEDEVC